MLKIEEIKKSDWLLVDADFRSLQMCLAFADSALNPKGMDQVAYDIYGRGGNNDAHSVTAFNTFYSPVHAEVIEIEDDSGKKFFFGDDQKIKVKHAGSSDEVEILGKDFNCESDTYIGWA